MTTFEDGPAKGQTLMLKRSPLFLRVTWARPGGEWDACDQLEDSPRDDEVVYVYRRIGKPSWCHINRGRHGSGMYSLATYRFYLDQRCLIPAHLFGQQIPPRVRVIEVKGGHIWSRDLVRFRGCRAEWQWLFDFELWQKKAGNWTRLE